jgi:hypothetical protein
VLPYFEISIQTASMSFGIDMSVWSDSISSPGGFGLFEQEDDIATPATTSPVNFSQCSDFARLIRYLHKGRINPGRRLWPGRLEARRPRQN